jgi:RNA polymerase sigma-70 factor (ECF subfamily)
MGNTQSAGIQVMEEQAALSRRAVSGDSEALALLFDGERPRLLRMIKLRMDQRLNGRVDAEDVLQEAFVDVMRRFDEYCAQYSESIPLVLWFRLILGQRLVDFHRRHLGTQSRDAGLEISLQRGRWPQATSASLAAQLLGKLTSASRAAVRAEQRLMVQEALNRMEPIDREVLVLRHFEHLTNDEVALMLGLKKTAASQRYVRALRRLATILSAIPGLSETP